MKKYEFIGNEYILQENYKDGFNKDEVLERVTDYFEDFDYIFGDYAYDKLRLKGFYDKEHSKKREVNSIEYLDNYVKNYCAYGAKWFLLKKNKK